MTEHSDKIRELNDQFRKAPTLSRGHFLLTEGVRNHCERWVIQQVQAYDDFTPDNDPYGEHDFGSMMHKGERIFWKIDYYDTNMEYGSPDPSDPAVTKRVLTVMLASEY